MARCGCSSACTCLVQGDGTTTTVDGNGNTGTPYVVHAIQRPPIEVLDTDTVDMTVTGAGVTGDPQIISSVVKISADADNCLIQGTDGALYVACPVPSQFDIQPGCGIQFVGNEIRANVQAWPFACDIDTNSTGVYCKENGDLAGTPPRYTATARRALGPTIDYNVATYCSTTDASLGLFELPGTRVNSYVTVANPDPCRNMVFDITAGALIRMDVPYDATGSSWFNSVMWMVTANGVDYTIMTMARGETAVDDATVMLNRTSPPAAIIVPPGGNLVLDVWARGARENACELTLLRLNTPEITVLGVSQ